jgi:hypothetical protein
VDVLGVVLLAAGYPAAVVVLTRLVPVLRERRTRWFLILEAATAAITAGWLLLGRGEATLINGAALVGFAIAWTWTGRRRGRETTVP